VEVPYVPIRKSRPQEAPRDFDFFRYEVWFGLAIGGFVASLIAVSFDSPVLGFWVSTLGVSWGLTHLVSRWMMRGRLDRKLKQEEEEERERRALANREAASIENEQASRRRHRRRR